MSLETIRLSQQAKEQLIRLKRMTGIKQWNVLCRWALCVSLADPSTPRAKDVITDSNVEMSWRTFAGEHGDIYLALLTERSAMEGSSSVGETMSSHLHRGIGMLAGAQIGSIEDLVAIT